MRRRRRRGLVAEVFRRRSGAAVCTTWGGDQQQAEKSGSYTFNLMAGSFSRQWLDRVCGHLKPSRKLWRSNGVSAEAYARQKIDLLKNAVTEIVGPVRAAIGRTGGGLAAVQLDQVGLQGGDDSVYVDVAVFDEDGVFVLRPPYRGAGDVEVFDVGFHRAVVIGGSAAVADELDAGEFEEGVVLFVADQARTKSAGTSNVLLSVVRRSVTCVGVIATGCVGK